ncbi:RelA/SpoT family protein [Kordiimonas aquimaris]|uniref:RelA/SpoT family protein n=1 Tax=Kordiimonas aquimaris TaxID=707591 RepID=UPI0021D1ADBB|nr:bifunctional (p)ppGpp synthetase/guanosine-3',5'-bis(diphosphate) 3'-pyrophosphohydrolase [Kordiimonas aquimaris]
MIRQFELVDKVRAYDQNVDEALLNRAYVFAMQAHGTQTRASGDPYFSHPLEVAGILTDMKLDSDTIATALLHDVIEDTVATVEQITDLFGPKIAEMVDGVTKLSKIEMQAETTRQAENFRKFLLAMSNDIRVLLVKLADRLHNMRTLHHISKPEKRRRISLETLEIYAPLAERIGMHVLKDELEHLSFGNLDAEAMESITARLNFLIEENPDLEREMVAALQELMDISGIKATVNGRIKKPYSIWRKMERQNISFEQLSDVMAFRVIVDSEDECYRALGVVHRRYSTIPGRFKDYISTPKRNFYRSIHTAVIGPKNRRLEIQVRTHDMHAEAELGVAAHWQYKQGTESVEGSQYVWVRELLEILEHAQDPEEFLEHTKLAMFQDKVFCFTPKGELISLPRGSSTVDFAYAVHTEVGDHCVGAKVNGRMVPLRHQLHNGDQVEILTSKAQTPSDRWDAFVVTGKARSAIRRHVRHTRHEEFHGLGRSLIEKACKRLGLDFSTAAMQEAASVLNVGDLDALYVAIGEGVLPEEAVLEAAFPGFQMDTRSDKLPAVHDDWQHTRGQTGPITGVDSSVALHMAECCHPVRGDRVVGIRVEGRGVEVHTIDCGKLASYDDKPELWVDLGWREAAEDDVYYVARLHLEVLNERGALASIAAVVAKAGGNMSNLEILERDPEFCIMCVEVDVQDVKHLNDIARALRVNRVIERVDRVTG